MSWPLTPRTISSHRYRGYTILQLEETYFDPIARDNIGRGRFWRVPEMHTDVRSLRAAQRMIRERHGHETLARETEHPTFVYEFTQKQKATLIMALACAAHDFSDPTYVVETLAVISPQAAATLREQLNDQLRKDITA